MARWFVNFDAIDPQKPTGRWKTGISEAHYHRIRVHGHEKHVARIVLVRSVLEDTRLIFQGWSRPDKDDCYVYVGSPNTDFKSLSIETPPPQGMVFLVFILPDGTIDDWCWRPSSAGDGMPDGVNGELIWSAKPN